jgi:hypothetical protein
VDSRFSRRHVDSGKRAPTHVGPNLTQETAIQASVLQFGTNPVAVGTMTARTLTAARHAFSYMIESYVAFGDRE